MQPHPHKFKKKIENAIETLEALKNEFYKAINATPLVKLGHTLHWMQFYKAKNANPLVILGHIALDAVLTWPNATPAVIYITYIGTHCTGCNGTCFGCQRQPTGLLSGPPPGPRHPHP